MPIRFIYGENSLASKAFLKKIIAGFKQKDSSGMNFFEFDAAENPEIMEKLKNATVTQPFLGKRKLVLVKNFISRANKNDFTKMTDLLKESPPPDFTELILYENGKVDKRSSLFRWLSKNSNAKEFNLPEPNELSGWIIEYTTALGGKIEGAAAQRLGFYVGNDVWQLSNEIKKLIAYCDNRPISPADVEKIVSAKISANIFDLTDAIGQKNLSQALKTTRLIVDQGENEIYVLSMLLYQIRNLVIGRSLLEMSKGPAGQSGFGRDSGKSLQFNIAKKAKLHPFVAGKLVPQTRNFSMSELKQLFARLVEIDEKIKTTRHEARDLLNQFVLKSTQKVSNC